MKVLKIYSRTCGPCKTLESNLQLAGIPHESIDVQSVEGYEKKKIRVKINGTIYPSIKEAAQELNMSEVTLGRWIKDERKIGYEIV